MREHTRARARIYFFHEIFALSSRTYPSRNVGFHIKLLKILSDRRGTLSLIVLDSTNGYSMPIFSNVKSGSSGGDSRVIVI